MEYIGEKLTKSGHPTKAYVQWLEETIASLRRELYNERLNQDRLRQRQMKQYRDAHDYLPYEDDDRR